MPGKSTATQDSNYNGAQKTKSAAEKTKRLSKKQLRKQAAKAAAMDGILNEKLDNGPAKTQVDFALDNQKANPTVAQKAHEDSIKFESAETRPEAAISSDGKAQSAPESSAKRSGGLVDAMKADYARTSSFAGDVSGILSGEAAAAEAEMGVSSGKTKTEQLKARSGKYLEDMGGGSKVLGGAKIAGYMVGASMLADMLNPFDDD